MTALKNYCASHPDREGKQYCSKYNQYLCEECTRCSDPTLYCKFRTMCPIWELARHPDEKDNRIDQLKAQ